MTKNNMLVFGIVIIATVLGLFGQGIAYFLNDNVAKIYPIYYLSTITLISIFLYLVALLVTYLSYKKKNNLGLNSIKYAILSYMSQFHNSNTPE